MERLETRLLLAAHEVAGPTLQDSGDLDAISIGESATVFGNLAAQNQLSVDFTRPVHDASMTPIASVRQIVFVDAGIEGYDDLVESITGTGIGSSENASIEIVVLDADRDGIAQISEVLEHHSGLAAVHVLSHGSSASLQLGNFVLDGDSLESVSGQMRAWGESIRDGGDLLIYGCDVGSGPSGVEFVHSIAQITGVDVAASIDLTGDGRLGGDWELELATGMIDVPVIQVADSLFEQVLVRNLTGDAAANTFTFTANAITGTGGVVTGSPVDLQADPSDDVIVQGLAGQDQAIFQAIPRFGLAGGGSEFDGGAGDDTIDFSRLNTDLAIQINNTHTGNQDGILVDAGTVFGKFIDVEVIRRAGIMVSE